MINKEDIRAILFDLDGTLFRSEACDYIAWNEALKQFNIFVGPESYTLYTGKSAEWVEADLIEKSGLDIVPNSIIDLKKKIFVEMFGEEEIALMPYAKEAVKFFRDKSYHLGLCTGGTKREVFIKLENSNMDRCFSVIVTADDVPSNKPAPDVYLSAIDRFGLLPNQCLAVEDTETGVMAAKSAGAFCFAIPNEFSKHQNLSKADRVLDSLKDLIDFFN
ncbi:MAG: HAD family phosphatase [Candidatus Pacebacteria bacterium]|nr:HAD family phosphatase [Candidatus Paceibacterota bacterium]